MWSLISNYVFLDYDLPYYKGLLGIQNYTWLVGYGEFFVNRAYWALIGPLWCRIFFKIDFVKTNYLEYVWLKSKKVYVHVQNYFITRMGENEFGENEFYKICA